MKNVPNGTKRVQGNKKIPWSKNEALKDKMGAKYNLLWHSMVLNCRVWPYMASCGLVWP